MYSLHYESNLIGTLTITSDGDTLSGVWFDHDRFSARRDMSGLEENRNREPLRLASKWFDSYFARENPDPGELPLASNLTEFQTLVRQAMLEIPYGETRTYSWIAKTIENRTGKSRSARAVGGAVGRNPLGIIVPCHRVVGSRGNLTGFGGGLATKVRLLKHEGADMRWLAMPKAVPEWNNAIDEANGF